MASTQFMSRPTQYIPIRGLGHMDGRTTWKQYAPPQTNFEGGGGGYNDKQSWSWQDGSWWGSSNEYPQSVFEQKYEKYQNFLSENFHFLVVKLPVYLNRHVFVMISPESGKG